MATSTALAPASSANLALISNAQVPRSTSATLPAYAPAGEAKQPCEGKALPSLTRTTLPLKLAAVAGAPKDAVP